MICDIALGVIRDTDRFRELANLREQCNVIKNMNKNLKSNRSLNGYNVI